ncbi:MAG: hypothetical protein QOJ07_3265, partial [Thermoleophilaceae bacterium]|nr:hypothetical protein [Thermoleophilaceae bacterium]
MTQAAPSRSAGDGAPPEPPSPPEPPAGARRRRDRLFPGDRRVWLTAAVVLAIGLVVVAVEVLTPRDFYTGTNSIRTRSFSTTLKRGDQLCVPRQSIPAGTGRIEMEVNSAQGAKSLPAQSAELRIAGRTIPLSDVPGGGPVGPRKITFALPGKRPRSPDSVPGTVCVRSAGGVTYGGMAALQGNDVPSTINGRPNLNRVAIWYLPPRGEKRSLLSQLPAVLARASLFRPGVVGPWTYAVLLLVWLPLLGYGALRLLATAAEWNPRRVALLVALLAFGNAAAWAIVTPAFNAPDESEHFAYVQWFAETGKTVARAPDPNRPIYSSQETLALDATRIFSNNEAADGRPPWLKLDERRLAQRTQAGYHGHPRQDNGGGNTAATQAHSPVYYGLLAPAYLVTRSGSTWTQLTAVRLLSALFGAVVAMCAFLLVRELVPRHPVPAVAAGLLVGFQPMFAFISGAVNNDNGVNALAAIVVFLVVRGLRRGLTWRTGLALGVALVVLPLMKATGYELYPLS